MWKLYARWDLKSIKNLLAKNVYDQFDEAIKDKKARNVTSETTFIGINSAEIKEHSQNKNMLEVSVEFVSEIISCIKDKDNKLFIRCTIVPLSRLVTSQQCCLGL